MTPTETPKPTDIINPVIGLFGRQAGNLTLASIIATLLQLSLTIAGLLLLFNLVTAGLQWMSSGGEKTSLAAARDKITNSFIGLVIIALLLVIVTYVNEILFKGEFDILKPSLPIP